MKHNVLIIKSEWVTPWSMAHFRAPHSNRFDDFRYLGTTSSSKNCHVSIHFPTGRARAITTMHAALARTLSFHEFTRNPIFVNVFPIVPWRHKNP